MGYLEGKEIENLQKQEKLFIPLNCLKREHKFPLLSNKFTFSKKISICNASIPGRGELPETILIT